MPEAPAGRDLCLLVEGNALRHVWMPESAAMLVERPKAAGLYLRERIWRYVGERALTGQRIFREANPLPPPPEPVEKPLYDELVIREPLKLS